MAHYGPVSSTDDDYRVIKMPTYTITRMVEQRLKVTARSRRDAARLNRKWLAGYNGHVSTARDHDALEEVRWCECGDPLFDGDFIVFGTDCTLCKSCYRSSLLEARSRARSPRGKMKVEKALKSLDFSSRS